MSGDGMISPAFWAENPLRDDTLAAYENRAGVIVKVACPICNKVIGKVFETPMGSLYAAELFSKSATDLALEWSAPKEAVGRIPDGFSPVRVLLDRPEDGGRGVCTAWCRKESALLDVDIATLRGAVERYHQAECKPQRITAVARRSA